jgi:hypothetical protein
MELILSTHCFFKRIVFPAFHAGARIANPHQQGLPNIWSLC